MRVRNARADDLPAIHTINQGEVPAVGDVTVDELAHIVELSAVAIVAEVDTDDDAPVGTIAGFCLVLPPAVAYGSENYRWFSERYADFVYLDRVAVTPAFRRRGLGRAFYAEVERRVAVTRPSTPWFTLEVNLQPRNDASLAFHAALGFVEVGQRTDTDGKVVSMMSKPLPA